MDEEHGHGFFRGGMFEKSADEELFGLCKHCEGECICEDDCPECEKLEQELEGQE